ncbi:hypothetical protein D3C71_2193230 [compost metagenome]
MFAEHAAQRRLHLVDDAILNGLADHVAEHRLNPTSNVGNQAQRAVGCDSH